MIPRCLFGLALSLVVAVAPASAQFTLAWKLKKGDKFFLETTTTTHQQLAATGGKPAAPENTVTTVSSFEVLSDEGGKYVLRQKVEGIQAKASDGTGPSAARAATVLKGAQFTFHLTPAGKISNFDGYADLLKKWTGGNDALEQEVRASYPESSFKDELATVFGFLPEQPVAQGATWKRDESLPLGRAGRLTGTTTYTYTGKADGHEQITQDSQLAFEATKGDASRLSNVKVTEGKGPILFDPAAGRLVKWERTLKMTATVTVRDNNDKDQTFNVQQTTTRTTRLLDKNPLEKAAP